MAELLMPSLGADMTEGTVLEWLVKPGDTVRKGDVAAVVDTAKAAVEVECFDSGVVGAILVPEGHKVEVGTPLAVIGGEPAAAAPQPVTTPDAQPAPSPVAAAEAPPPLPLATPPARTLAAQSGVDLATVHGTGQDGRITPADVLHAAPAPHVAVVPPPPAVRPEETPPTRPRISPYARRLAGERGIDLGAVVPGGADGVVHARDLPRAGAPVEPAQPRTPRQPQHRDDDAMRQAIATLMARSKREIPHYYLTATIDLHAATTWLRDRNRRVPVTERLLPAALLLKASALAASQVPELNGYWQDGAFVAGLGVHLGVAVSLRGGGLVAPAISNTDELSLAEIMARLRDLVSRVRAGRLRSSEMTSATITVTNLGELGVESVQGVIYPPQVALVGFGAIQQRPWVVDGLIGPRPIVVATLAADHRASDGARGARFLNALDHLLQRPEELS